MSKYDEASKLYEERKYSDAESACVEWLANNLLDPNAWMLLEQIYHRQKDLERASKCIDARIIIHRKNEDLLEILCSVHAAEDERIRKG